MKKIAFSCLTSPLKNSPCFLDKFLPTQTLCRLQSGNRICDSMFTHCTNVRYSLFGALRLIAAPSLWIKNARSELRKSISRNRCPCVTSCAVDENSPGANKGNGEVNLPNRFMVVDRMSWIDVVTKWLPSLSRYGSFHLELHASHT